MADPELPYAQVVHRVLGVGADTDADADLRPDLSVLEGLKVTFTPRTSVIKWLGAGGPVTHPPKAVTGVYDSQGYLRLTQDSTQEGVWLLASSHEDMVPSGWTYTAKWSLNAIPAVPFHLAPGAVIDLTTVIPVPSNPGSQLTDWLAAVAAAQAAQAAAEAAASEAAEAVEAVSDGIPAAVADYLTANPPSGSPDATTLTKGIVKLAGDLGGTADAPTVPGLAGKEPARGPDDNYVTDAEKAALHTHPAVIAQGATAAAARAAIGAGTSSFSGAYADLTGKPTIPDTEAIQDVVGAMVAGAGGTYDDAGGSITLPAGSRTLLATQTATGTAVTFSGIPQTYAAIRVEWSAANAGGGGKARSLTVNGDTGANYATSGNTGGQASIPVLAPQAGVQSAWIEIMGYATAKNQILSGQSVGNINWGNANIALALIGGVWLGGAAVTSLTFTPSDSVRDVCTYRLYGLY